jgi:2-dehydropantoate 2-reductase
MRIALVGAGSLGMIMGSLLTKNGEDIVLVDVNDVHVRAMKQNGAKITGQMELTVPVKAITPHELTGVYDLVIYLAKTTHDDKALPQILPFLGNDSMVLTLQNGIPEEKVASVLGKERTLGGAVGWGGTLVGPGVSELTTDPDLMPYDIGELDGSVTERIEAVKAILDKAGRAEVSTNLIGLRWTKLMVNVSMSAVGTALDCTYGDILDDDRALVAAVSVMVETLKTARALGVQVEPMQGSDPYLLLDVIKQGGDMVLEMLRMLWDKYRDAVPSMLQDLRKGLPCEVEALNGYLSRKSAEAGVPTPINDRVAEIIRGIQDGRYPLSFGNLDMIDLRPLQAIV